MTLQARDRRPLQHTLGHIDYFQLVALPVSSKLQTLLSVGKQNQATTLGRKLRKVTYDFFVNNTYLESVSLNLHALANDFVATARKK